MFRRAKPGFDNEVAAILARLRRSRIVCSDETTVRIDGRTHWNWVFQNDQVVIHIVSHSRAGGVVAEVMAGHRPSIWVSDLYSAQQGHADIWQVCLAHYADVGTMPTCMWKSAAEAVIARTRSA